MTPDAGLWDAWAAPLWWLLPLWALWAGAVALAPLGALVLARGVVFSDLAVAQAAAAAALWVGAAWDHPSAWATQMAASAGALACAALVWALVQRAPTQREALIGLLYVAGAALALLGARLDPHGRERLQQLLAADLLWASPVQAMTLSGVALAVLALCITDWGRRFLRGPGFYAVFALAVSLAVPVLGLLAVFALLIAPALLGSSRRAVVATMAAGAVGLAGSWWADWPSGACTVLAIAALGLITPLLQKK
jgi:zinc/manganese transport system permease protein